MTTNKTSKPQIISLWTVYRGPRDSQDFYVARRFEIASDSAKPTLEMFTASTLAEVRARLPSGLICMNRHKDDHPTIVEVWV